MVSLPGRQAARPTSLTSPGLQLGLSISMLLMAAWCDRHAPTVLATDQWAWNAAAAVLGLFGLLYLPFSVAAWIKVVTNRRRQRY